uniref:G-protein coupled receptors family 1 profile domain-containing protein n=1 Tax=Acrobeloides nanus TaxID=290746 RepID=A0A914E146_9BILA
MFICVYKSIVGTMISFWVPPDTLSCAIFYCFALIESGYNPYMYLLLNRTLRKQVFNVFSKKTSGTNRVHIRVVYNPSDPETQMHAKST